MKKYVIVTKSDQGSGCRYCAFYQTKHCKGFLHPDMFMCRRIQAATNTFFHFKEVI